ncbi:HEPN domain-containing protein [Comamonas testosteroni]|uniref:HEPN domain-containing protein n=1 Tax=Comamonas testosteroni TaxID=285 RepID=UPI000AD20336|nr:HEPN domain-containing protein [Comamonas testosteroni]
MFKYLSDAVWERLPVTDFRARFFVECFIEKLRMHTPHFYQARLMNVISASKELRGHVENYRSNEKNIAYLQSAMEELSDCWDGDPIAQEILGDLIVLRAPLLKVVLAGDVSENILLRVSQLARAILCREETYTSALIASVEREVVGPVDLTQKERITSQIDRITGLLITHLLNEGYSPTYLYNRSELFTRENKYRGRTFSEQLAFVLDRLKHQQTQFDAYYGIHTTKPSLLLGITDEPGLNFLPEIPDSIQGAEREKFKKNIDITVVAHATLSATDYVSAALKTKERLDKFLDAATALEIGSEFQVSAHCATVDSGPPVHLQTINVDVLLAFMVKEAGTSFAAPGQSLRQVFRSLDDSAKDQLERSLRYLRLARNAASLEQKLLDLWIALESLFITRNTTILQGILDFVPQLYASAGLHRRVAYLKGLLVANEVAIPPLCRAVMRTDAVIFDNNTEDHHIFALLRDEPAAIELFNSMGEREHLKFKFMQIFRDLKDNKSLAGRLAKSELDVRRQMRRIYYLRNKIAHTGHFQGVRPQLVTHLLDYLAICYRSISAAAARAVSGDIYSVPELLSAARMGADLVSARVAARDEVLELSFIVPEPVV